MARKASILTVILAVAALSVASAAPKSDSGPAMTLVDFSRSLLETLQNSGVQTSATASLVRGVIAGREQTPLTEGVAVTLLGVVGLEASTTTPGRQIDQARAQALLRSVSGQADSLRGYSSAAASATSTQGSIDPCLSLANHGQCVKCCKDQGMPANSCAKACFVINKPSPSEPLP